MIQKHLFSLCIGLFRAAHKIHASNLMTDENCDLAEAS